MWDLIVSVPDHCLSYYFIRIFSAIIKMIFMLDIRTNMYSDKLAYATTKYRVRIFRRP